MVVSVVAVIVVFVIAMRLARAMSDAAQCGPFSNPKVRVVTFASYEVLRLTSNRLSCAGLSQEIAGP